MCWTCTCWCSSDSPNPWKLEKKHPKSFLWNLVSQSHTHTHSPKTCHTASLEANPAQRQVVTDWQLSSTTADIYQYLHATSCSWTNGMWRQLSVGSAQAHSIKTRTPLWGPQIPVCPSFPLRRNQIPSRGLSGPAVQSRQSQGCRPDGIRRSHSHSLTRRDYSLTTLTSERRHDERVW